MKVPNVQKKPPVFKREHPALRETFLHFFHFFLFVILHARIRIRVPDADPASADEIQCGSGPTTPVRKRATPPVIGRQIHTHDRDREISLGISHSHKLIFEQLEPQAKPQLN